MVSDGLYTSTLDICSSFRVTEEIAVEGEKKLDAKKPSGEEDADETEEKEPEKKVDVKL